MQPVWQADSEAVLEALRESPLRESRPQQFHALFGYILGNRDGIDNWRLVPAALRRSIGRRIAPVRCGSGVIEKISKCISIGASSAKAVLDRCRRRTARSTPLAPVPAHTTGTIGGTKPL